MSVLWCALVLGVWVFETVHAVQCPRACKCEDKVWYCNKPSMNSWPLDGNPQDIANGVQFLDLSGSGISVLPNWAPTHNFPDLQVIILYGTVFDGGQCRELECLEKLGVRAVSGCGQDLRQGCSQAPCCHWAQSTVIFPALVTQGNLPVSSLKVSIDEAHNRDRAYSSRQLTPRPGESGKQPIAESVTSTSTVHHLPGTESPAFTSPHQDKTETTVISTTSFGDILTSSSLPLSETVVLDEVPSNIDFKLNFYPFSTVEPVDVHGDFFETAVDVEPVTTSESLADMFSARVQTHSASVRPLHRSSSSPTATPSSINLENVSSHVVVPPALFISRGHAGHDLPVITNAPPEYVVAIDVITVNTPPHTTASLPHPFPSTTVSETTARVVAAAFNSTTDSSQTTVLPFLSSSSTSQKSYITTARSSETSNNISLASIISDLPASNTVDVIFFENITHIVLDTAYELSVVSNITLMGTEAANRSMYISANPSDVFRTAMGVDLATGMLSAESKAVVGLLIGLLLLAILVIVAFLYKRYSCRLRSHSRQSRNFQCGHQGATTPPNASKETTGIENANANLDADGVTYPHREIPSAPSTDPGAHPDNNPFLNGLSSAWSRASSYLGLPGSRPPTTGPGIEDAPPGIEMKEINDEVADRNIGSFEIAYKHPLSERFGDKWVDETYRLPRFGTPLASYLLTNTIPTDQVAEGVRNWRNADYAFHREQFDRAYGDADL